MIVPFLAKSLALQLPCAAPLSSSFEPYNLNGRKELPLVLWFEDVRNKSNNETANLSHNYQSSPDTAIKLMLRDMVA